VDLHFEGEIFYWRGPAPFHFVAVPDRESALIHAARSELTYGWGVIPVEAEIGRTEWTTSLFPKGGRYLVPVKTAVRKAEGVELGDLVNLRLGLDM
jgi:hypothetical protein